VNKTIFIIMFPENKLELLKQYKQELEAEIKKETPDTNKINILKKKIMFFGMGLTQNDINYLRC